jgi:drug/metabolite transporter (DMT)-like permease
MLAASFGIFVHYVLNAAYQQTSLIHELPIPILGFIVALGLIATVIPSFLLNWGMKQVGSNNLAIITSIGPVATLFQTNLILGEPFTWYQFIGTTLVIIGVLLIKNLG